MKKITAMAAVLMLVLLSGTPPKGRELSELLPVETVQILFNNGEYTIRTDSEAGGKGKSIQEAVQNMHSAAAAGVFLETADYIIISPNLVMRKSCADEIADYIRPGAKICMADRSISLKKIPEYLNIHKPEKTFEDWRGGMTDLKIIREEGEGYLLA